MYITYIEYMLCVWGSIIFLHSEELILGFKKKLFLFLKIEIY